MNSEPADSDLIPNFTKLAIWVTDGAGKGVWPNLLWCCRKVPFNAYACLWVLVSQSTRCILCRFLNLTLLTGLDMPTKVKVTVHTLDIAPLRSETPPQKCSGMARVLNGFHSFTCTPTRSSAIGMSHTCLCFPSLSRYSFTDPGGMEGWLDLGAK